MQQGLYPGAKARDATGGLHPLPKAQASDLCLTIPTQEELEAVHKLSFAQWGDSLTLPQYLEESVHLTGVPLAKDDGMVSWILTDRNQLPDQRPILGSCETFRKRAFVINEQGQMSENIIYGIASVFVNPSHRSQGYGSRLMHELARVIPEWHVGSLRSIGSILYSDIGKNYYEKHGWRTFPVNNHIEFDPMHGPIPLHARQIQAEDLPQLCQDDEAMARKMMASSPPGKSRIMIVPDVDHMLWHTSKEEFACQKIFGRVPQAKGAIAGDKGCRIWAIWVHRYYRHPESSSVDNTLYILRFVIENQTPTPEQLQSQIQYAKAILQAAQAEAVDWQLQCIKLWHPTSLVQRVVERSGLDYRRVEREEDSIASLRWFGEGGAEKEDLEWVACEKYAWV